MFSSAAEKGQKMPKLIACVFILSSLVFLISCQSNRYGIAEFDDKVNLYNAQDKVVLLHGMYRDSIAMQPVEQFLSAQGYEVTSISYPSTAFNIQTLVKEHLEPVVKNLKTEGNQKIHFVTHSMGGILVRYYLKHHPLEQLGKVVMIAPPNHGTELAELFMDSTWIDTKSNPAKLQLSAQDDSWVNQLGPVNFELGIIAGNDNSNWITDWLLQGDDDGVVSVESTKVDNMQDFIIVPEKHFRLRGNRSVLQQAAYFLKYANFYRAASLEIGN